MDGEVLPTPWDLWIEYLLHGVLLGNNIVPGAGGPPPLSWTFIGILVTFLVTRSITRLIRHRSDAGGAGEGPIRNIVIGGVHIHHQVFGIVLMMLAGLLLVATQPSGTGLDILSVVLGVGIGLAFDEFALWLHLDDVYWNARGRKSVDAVAVVLVLTGVVTIVVATVANSEEIMRAAATFGLWLIWLQFAGILITFVPSVICLLKGKTIAAGVGVAYVPIGLVGAFRLAKPESWWAHRFYRSGGRRQLRAAERFGVRYQARWNRVRDLVAGSPTEPSGRPGDLV